MPDRRILYVSPHQIAVFHWQAGTVSNDASFESSNHGVAAFREYLTNHPHSIFSILANLPEEGFQIETIPFLQRRDRDAVITRKLSQLFYTTPYTASLSLGYEKTRRKDEKLLLAALTGQATLEPWVDALREARIALTGIYSLPFIGEMLLSKARITDERCIVLTLQDQSIRETYFENGKLHFSRLSQLNNTSIVGIAQSFAAEAIKLQQYLLSQRLIARNQTLRALIVAHPQALPAIETSCISTEALNYQFLSTDECSHQLGLKNAPASSHIDTLFAHVVATKAPVAQFAKEPLRHDYHLWQLRKVLYGLGTIALIGCLVFSCRQFYSAYSHNSEASDVAEQAQLARQRYEDIARTFPPIPTSNETLRQIMNRYTELESGGSTPELLFLDISKGLAQAPAIDLDSIDWKGPAATTATTNSTQAPPDGNQRALLKGTVNLGSRATPRQLLTAFEDFVEALRSNPLLAVKVTQQPFDTDSGKALRSGSANVTETGARPFALEITRRKAP
ncbi:MAG: hypothetical protein H6943_10525 [Zoogloeaceae bacterium]|nr:hypothetical protein [Zoogloeaceae bacterium]